MPTYIRFPIETNPQQLALDVYNYIRARSPQWNPNDGNLDVWIAQAFAAVAADNRDLASDVPDDIFRYFGSSLLALPPLDEAQSTVASTWTMIDNAGHTIPAGTVVSINDIGGNPIPFETLVDTIVAAGATTTGVGAVLLRSINGGAGTAGLGGAGVVAQLQDVLEFVQTVTLTGVSTGGQDAEDDDAYMNRLVRRMRLLSTRPILPPDFALLARDVPGVYRVVAIDLYDPVANTYGHERTVTLAALDANGSDVDAGTNAAIAALVVANREQNFVVHTMGAKRTTIDVTFTAKAAPGYTTADVEARAEANVAAYLNPAVWGALGNDPQDWTDIQYVRYSEIAQVISDTEGLDYWQTLTIRKPPAAMGTVDVALDAPASLAVAGAIAGTVT
jgi:uncharacterized phage protein gp47/JayE